MNNTLLLIVALLMCSVGVGATNYTSVADGDWNNPNNWSPVGVPNVSNTAAWPGDNVTIDHAISYTGNLKTAKQASVTINNGGALNVSGTLDVANSNNSTFTLASGGLLVTGNFVMSSCCNVVTLNGTMNTGNFSFTGSKPLTIGGMVTINGDFNGGTNSSITFTGGRFEVAGTTTAGGSVQLLVDGGTELELGNLNLTGNADIKGINAGGVIGWTTLSMANNSTTIQCVNNACNYSGGNGSSVPPSPLDLVTGSQALPVELISFSAKAVSNAQVLLSWSTALESNNEYYLLEYSTDGKNFEFLATIEGMGTTQEQTYYEWVHNAPKSSTSYYRLWQYDFDGSYSFLGLKEVAVESKAFTIAGVSPNPGFSGSSIYLDMPTNTHSIQVQLVCSSGQQWPLLLAPGEKQLQLPSGLPSGLYYLQLVADNKLQTIPLAIIGG